MKKKIKAKEIKYILAIETSCDDNCVSILANLHGKKEILANIIINNHKEHENFGGIVPQIAARQHFEFIDIAVTKAILKAQEIDKNFSFAKIGLIAVTIGPGLIGSLNIGVMMAKSLSINLGVDMVTINHLEAHILSPLITIDVPNFPYLMLLVSGGHCQIIRVNNIGAYKRLGTTIDDSVGEVFDKIARELNLPMPGGAEIEKLAKGGNPEFIDAPLPLRKVENCNFSYSGLKTFFIQKLRNITKENNGTLSEQIKKDFAASVQKALFDHLLNKLERAIKLNNDIKIIQISGGVACNNMLRERVSKLAKKYDLTISFPKMEYCMDNAAMIANAAMFKIEAEQLCQSQMNEQAKSRYLYTLDTEGTEIGSGKRGRKN